MITTVSFAGYQFDVQDSEGHARGCLTPGDALDCAMRFSDLRLRIESKSRFVLRSNATGIPTASLDNLAAWLRSRANEFQRQPADIHTRDFLELRTR